MSAVQASPGKEASAESTLVLPSVVGKPESRFRPTTAGWFARGLVWAALAWFVFAVPGNFLSPFDLHGEDIGHLITAAVFVITGLSLNILIGYTGTISLGHQAFVGIGAFMAAYMEVDLGIDFWLAVPIAAIVGGMQAAVLGAISLRLTGLYFALVTFAYGVFTEESIFGIISFTGGDAGKAVTRPMGFQSPMAYYYLCLGFVVVVLWLDWRLTKTKGGRALQALRENPRVASSYGINVKAYTLLAFVTSGVFAAVAGALFAHGKDLIVPQNFGFELALSFILMTVVGGLRNRAGVVIGSAFFALMEGGWLFKTWLFDTVGVDWLIEDGIGLPLSFVPHVLGPILLILTLTTHPGGIGQQIAPIKEWMLGRKFNIHTGKVRDVEVTDVRA
jgi:branched-chain amino acid transport system permease protein